MAKNSPRQTVMLQSTESPHRRYVQTNTRNNQEGKGKLELKKFDPVVGKVVTYKEKKLPK